MANIITRKYKPTDPGLKRDLGEANKRLDKPGHFNKAQRQDAKDLLKTFGIKKSEKWGVLD